SRSLALTPACFSARSMVGTIASRWAREATSGTTPPKRACSSTLEATASARSVVPRTMPTPVSSQEVSMPRTSGSSRMSVMNLGSLSTVEGGRVRAVAVGRHAQAHHQGVDVPRLVVAAPDADRLEAEALVELLGAHIVHPALEQHLGALERGRGPQQLGEQPGAEP